MVACDAALEFILGFLLLLLFFWSCFQTADCYMIRIGPLVRLVVPDID